MAFRVDKIHDIQDLVLKGLSHQVLKTELYKGAALMSDQSVALVIDCKKVIEKLNIKAVSPKGKTGKNIESYEDAVDYLIFTTQGEQGQLVVPLDDVYRLENIKSEYCSQLNDQYQIPYLGGIANLIHTASLFDASQKLGKEDYNCMVIKKEERFYIFTVEEIVSVFQDNDKIHFPLRQGIATVGKLKMGDTIARVFDVGGVIEAIKSQKSILREAS